MKEFANFLVLLLFGVLIPASLCAVGLVYWQAEEFFTGGLYMGISAVWWIIMLSGYKS